MARYIDAERLKEAFSTDAQYIRDWDADLFDLLMLDIDEAPTADVAEVNHGKWISEGTGYAWRYICSECGWEDVYPFDDRHRFCPNCGAKMEGEA